VANGLPTSAVSIVVMAENLRAAGRRGSAPASICAARWQHEDQLQAVLMQIRAPRRSGEAAAVLGIRMICLLGELAEANP
jgi:hypothetical protein